MQGKIKQTGRLIQFLLLVTIISANTACINNSRYQADARSGYGYVDTKLADDHYQIQFTLRGDSTELAYEHALLRAAELTLEMEHRWFEVLERDEKIEHDNKIDPSQLKFNDFNRMGNNCHVNCGSGEANFSARGTELAIDKSVSKTVSTIKIRILKNELKNRENIFSANDTWKSLKLKLDTPNSMY